jgi:hypothetical protein
MTDFTQRNRANAQHSSGPTSPTGKARSSQNALKNGLYALSAKLPGEDKEEYLAHAAAFIADLKPVGATQEALVEIVSDNTWRLRRVRGVIESETNLLLRLYDSVDEMSMEAFLNGQATGIRVIESVSRHEQRLQNGTLKALKQLKELQKEARLEQERSAKNKTPSGFVPAPEFKAAAASETAQNQTAAPVMEAQKQAA